MEILRCSAGDVAQHNTHPRAHAHTRAFRVPPQNLDPASRHSHFSFDLGLGRGVLFAFLGLCLEQTCLFFWFLWPSFFLPGLLSLLPPPPPPLSPSLPSDMAPGQQQPNARKAQQPAVCHGHSRPIVEVNYR
jgi:hypothetical protein